MAELQQTKGYFDRALDIELKKLGPKHIDVATTYNNLGVVQREMGNLQQAKEYYGRALVLHFLSQELRTIILD